MLKIAIPCFLVVGALLTYLVRCVMRPRCERCGSLKDLNAVPNEPETYVCDGCIEAEQWLQRRGL